MSRATIYDEGVGGDLRVRAPYEVKDRLKPFGRWCPVTRSWLVSRANRDELVAVLRHLGVTVDEVGATTRTRRTSGQTWPAAMFAALPSHLHEPVYKALAKVLHPDVGGDADAARDLIAAYRRRSAAA